MTFLAQYALNPSLANHIDDEIDEWNSRAYDLDSKPELHEHLGMTEGQYARWVKDHSSLDAIAAEYLEANSLMAKMARGEASERDLPAHVAEHASSGASVELHAFLGLSRDEMKAVDGGTLTLAQIRNERLRKEALQTAFDALSGYLLDACPDDESWEEFDPDVDQIRTLIAEAQAR